jgi:hypothetical protein
MLASAGVMVMATPDSVRARLAGRLRLLPTSLLTPVPLHGALGACAGLLLVPPGAIAQELPPAVMSEAAFEALLLRGDATALRRACLESAGAGLTGRLQGLRERLLHLHPAPQPFEVVMADAEALLDCRSPDAALKVLSRYGPAPGPRRRRWLLLRWRAAAAALDHRRAALALHRLAGGTPGSLDGVLLPVTLREDGTWTTRPALDVLADHYVAIGAEQRAAAVLLAGRTPGDVAARRLGLAASLLEDSPLEERVALMETALDQAAAGQAWGLALDLLRLQEQLELSAGGDGVRPRSRRLRLSRRLDDAYGEWRTLGEDPAAAARRESLESLLRSPRAAGGHAGPPGTAPADVQLRPDPAP